MEYSEERIEAIARVIHEANRAYCVTLSDHTQVAWDEAPGWQRESLIAGVRLRIANPLLSPADAHKAWCKKKLEDGWSYGPVKDERKKTHPCLVPHEDLPESQQRKDYLSGAIFLALTEPLPEPSTPEAFPPLVSARAPYGVER